MTNSDTDAVLAYRNFLAAEDHLDELIYHATSREEELRLKQMEHDTIFLRDSIMPPEVDSTKHCLVKHYATAYEAVRERWKALQTEELYWHKRLAYELLTDALEMLWGRKINICERCYDGNNTDGGGHSRDEARHGQSREPIQTVSLGGGLSLSSLQEAGPVWTATDGSRGEAFQRESLGATISAGDTDGKDDTNRQHYVGTDW